MAAEPISKAAEESKESPSKDAVSIDQRLNEFISLIQKSAVNYDPRYILKVFRELTPVRPEITANSLNNIVESTYPTSHSNKPYLLKALSLFTTSKDEDAMDTSEDGTSSSQSPSNGSIELTPEVDIFIHLLIQIFLHDKKEIRKLDEFNGFVVNALKSYNRRTLDYIQAKVWFYIFRAKELLKDLIPIRADLLSALRAATLRHDTETRASTITLLLRDYLAANDINQAYNLVDKTEFPVDATNSVVARYNYYLARINAIQLDYSSASECAITAIRKCPQTKSALGFLQSATKLNILIQLLTGEIPELSTFRDPILEKSLIPYLAVTRAVRLGDLKLFNEVLNEFGENLKKDNNYNLVLRLRQNVIKTGIRTISLSYKRISLKDICIKLHLDSELSAEYIVGKAIKDGVIEATINHKEGYMQSREILDVYQTKAPQDEFDRRIKFCMSLHNDSVKAMRYPESANRVDLKADLEAREREQELMSYLQDDDFY